MSMDLAYQQLMILESKLIYYLYQIGVSLSTTYDYSSDVIVISALYSFLFCNLYQTSAGPILFEVGSLLF